MIVCTHIHAERTNNRTIDSKGTATVKAQKRNKSIIKIVHVTSVVQPITKLQEYILCAKKTKIMILFNNSSPPLHPGAILESITHVHAMIKM